MSEEETTEPTVTETKPEEPKSDELQAMMTRLDELGITNVEQLENKATAASEAGRLANLVGDLREEVNTLKSKSAAPATNEYGEDGIDIESAIVGAVDKALDKREQKAKKINAARVQEAHAIRSNKNYPLIAEKFERFMTTPQAKGLISSGQTPTTIFNDMVIGEYRNMAVTMKTAIEETAGDPSKTLVPHMEDGQTAPPRTEPADEKRSKLKNIKENWSGNDEDITAVLNALLPSGSLPMPPR